MVTPDAAELRDRRDQMVDRDIAGRGIHDERVLDAMREVPRERFLPPEFVQFAYENNPLPIAEGQTISQPYIVATMVDAAEIASGDRVLEIGTGSGYGAAVLSRVASEVWTIERHSELAVGATTTLRELGYDNVTVVVGDGTLGCPEGAPFDAVVVTAGGPSVPEALVKQLADGGRLIMPVGPETGEQELVRIRFRNGETMEEDLGSVRFVPLIGAQGW